MNVDYAELAQTIASLTHGETDEVALMATLACEIHHADDRFDWTGFYRVTEPELLKIGPYQGGHGCLVIPFARGVCGAAARTGQTQLVPDVDAFPGHIACASSTRSELVIPVEGSPDDEKAQAERIRAQAQGEAAFASAAREYSAARTAGSGGKLDWMPVSNLSPDLQAQVLRLQPGQVTPPISVPNAVVLLQLRAIADAEGGTSGEQTVEYARLVLPEGPDAAAQIARIKAEVDTCNDLYAAVNAQAVQRETKPMGQIPGDIALELARMDPGEI